MNFDEPNINTDADYFYCKLFPPHNVADLPHHKELLPHRMDNLTKTTHGSYEKAFGSLFFLDRPLIFRHFQAYSTFVIMTDS